MITVAQARPSERAEFIKKTYLHLAGAVGAFIVVEFLMFQLGIAQALGRFVASSSFGFLLLLGGFMILGSMASGLAAKASDINTQYMGLGLYVLGEAVIFAPLLFFATLYGDNVLPAAALVTLCLFGGLTAVVFTTGQDFTFLGGALKIFGLIALGLIACCVIFWLILGIFFSYAMVA